MTTVERFDLEGPLPTGTLAIEASAGTGKTYALAALATRCVAEFDVKAAELLIVTFTRAATQELRNRVRTQLVEVADALRAGMPPGTDPWIVELGTTDPEERQRRVDRLERAVTEFDAMAITTIHGFATQVLATLGTEAGVDPDVTLVDDAEELLAEVCSDVLAAAAVGSGDPDVLPKLKALTEATGRRLSMPDLDLVPTSTVECDDPAALVLVGLIDRCVEVIGERRRRAGTMSFDDVLLHLRDALEGDGGAGVVEALRKRSKVALIDEFQDTDPVQWAIFSTLFGRVAPGSRLVLVGDPKQAIYSFRGANVHTFSRAVTADAGVARRSLETNWRSDGALLTALNTLFDGATFGDPRITYVDVDPAEPNAAKRLVDRHDRPVVPLSIRMTLDPQLQRNRNRAADINVRAAERAIFGDLGEHVVELLGGARLPEDDGSMRQVVPSDIAVLVKSHREAEAVQRALLSRRVPAVLARSTSVLGSPAADHWRLLLEALQRPSDPRRARAFALSWFAAETPDQVATLDDDALSHLQDQLQRWNEVLEAGGVAEWASRVVADSGVEARVLATGEGDRLVTDLHHVAELFHSAAHHDRLSVAGLLAVLDRDPDEDIDADAEQDVGSSARRVESDDKAVQILTIWTAKGLEFPIVCVPTLWRTPLKHGLEAVPVIYQDPDTDRRTYDVAPKAEWPTKEASDRRSRLSRDEAIGENLRLLYVALTRARHHTLVWWSRVQDADRSGLAHLLFSRTDGRLDANFADEQVALPPDEEAAEALAPLVARSGGTMAVGVHGQPPTRTVWTGPVRPAGGGRLSIAPPPQDLDRSRHRWSFSAVTQQFEEERGDPYDPSLSDGGAGDEGRGEEHPDGDPPGTPEEAPAITPHIPTPIPTLFDTLADPPWATLPAGASFGNLVHGVLEGVDFADHHLDGALEREIDSVLAELPVDLTPVGDTDAGPEAGRRRLVDGLRAALETPLGPLVPGTRLRDVGPGDRLNELSFELLLGEGGHRATVTDIGRLALDHLGADDPLRPWAEGLATGTFHVDLAGHLTGSIDLVLRTAGPAPRFVVADYKTNRLTPRGQAFRPDHYARGPMAEAMAEHHYPLQALLYSVVLHRYLRWRLAGYHPATHLGGAAYLFVRGMAGAGVTVEDGHPHGVFSWAIPPELVVELSDRLDGRSDGTSS